jgi:Glutamyl-tRNAGlu reductase, N-terminal domain
MSPLASCSAEALRAAAFSTGLASEIRDDRRDPSCAFAGSTEASTDMGTLHPVLDKNQSNQKGRLPEYDGNLRHRSEPAPAQAARRGAQTSRSQSVTPFTAGSGLMTGRDVAVTQARSTGVSLHPMKLAELQVLHLDATSFKVTAEDHAAAAGQGQAWVIGTCQRTVIVAMGRTARVQIAGRLPVVARAQGFEGAEAYAFLLRFACGLESRLVGEFSAAPGFLSRHLDSWVQLLFQDTKEIRARQLSGLGSASYGSQVRRLLGTVTVGPTLLVGAGQLAQAVAPWLETRELLLWNRTTDRAHELARLVQERNPQRVCRVLDGTPAAELAAWSRAGDVVLCVPADEACDAERIAAWRARAPHSGRIVHLGLGESHAAHWDGVPGLTSLSALFDMLRAQSDLRGVQVTRARRACAEKAVLRSLGPNATQAHGWEDLAAFATISP